MSPNTPTVKDLLSRNSKYAETYKPSHAVEDFAPGVRDFPSVIIVSCCDPRIIPEEFGLFSREEYVVVRNAGGRAEPAVRDIVVLSTMTTITDVVVVHHVDCGMTHLTNAAIRQGLKDAGLGDDKVDTYEFGEIRDLEQSVRDDIKFLQSSSYISKKINIHGYVFDLLKTGRMIQFGASKCQTFEMLMTVRCFDTIPMSPIMSIKYEKQNQ